MSEVYWAKESTEKMGSIILEKFYAYKKYMENSGILGELRKSYKSYYPVSKIQDVDQSLKAIVVNHYANLIRHIHVMVTSQRPSWEPRAINTDLQSQSDTQLASGLLDYYMREKQLEKNINKAVETALFLREGWISCQWDVNKGEAYGIDPDTDTEIREGDIVYKNHTILDVVRDVRRRDLDHNWYILREFENKYDLAEKYPNFAEKILAMATDERKAVEYELDPTKYTVTDDNLSDDIPVYTLYYKKSASVPEGRMTKIVDHDITLFDGPLPYKSVHLYHISTSEQIDNAFCRSNAFDLMPIQDALNMTYSAILTNQAANAVQNFQMPKGGGLKVTQVMSGMNVMEFDPKTGPMAPLELLKTAPEVFNFSEMLVKQSELISGVNEISRGNAPASLSGAAMALIQQQAIQFSSGLQSSYNSFLEQIGTATIELLQEFAESPRVAQIVGKNKKSMLKEFKNTDLLGISRVVIDMGNPLLKTGAGKMEIANTLLQSGLIKTPEQYIMVLTTGNVEPLYEHERATQSLIRQENEMLMAGQQPTIFITDDDALHILEHSCVFADPDARHDVNVVNAGTAHIQEHINQAKSKDPVLASMLKTANFAPPPMAPPQQQGQGQNQMVNAMKLQNPVTEQADKVKPAQPAHSPIPMQ